MSSTLSFNHFTFELFLNNQFIIKITNNESFNNYECTILDTDLNIRSIKKFYNILNIPINELSFREGSMEELKSIPLAVPFNRLPLEEVVKTHCHFISAINKR